MALVSTLNTEHHEFDERSHKEWRALYRGGWRWHELKRAWFGRLEQETPASYDKRMQFATYENNAGSIVDLLVGGLFTQPPEITEYEGNWVQPFLNNVDRRGTDFVGWLQERLKQALEGRKVFAWVNLPKRSGAKTLLEQEQNGDLDAFLVALEAYEVIDWEHDDDGNLLWIMHRAYGTERRGVGEKRRRTCTWTYIDNKVVRRWRWYGEPGKLDQEPRDAEEVAVLDVVEHGIGTIPVVELCLNESMHIMGKMRDPALALTRAQNDLDWALHRGAHPLLYIISKFGDSDDPVIGPGVYMKLTRDKDGADQMAYAEPSGALYKVLADRVMVLREALYRIVHEMALSADGNATRAQLSGESKDADWRATETVLTAFSIILRPFIKRVLALVSSIREETPQVPVVLGLAGWHEQELLPFVTAVSLATEIASLSETWHREIAKKQLRMTLANLPADIVEKIYAEIEAGDVDLELYKPVPKDDPSANSRNPNAPRDQDGDGVIDEQ